MSETGDGQIRPRTKVMRSILLLPALSLIAIGILGWSGTLENAITQTPIGQFHKTAVSYLDSSQKKAVEAFAAGRAINAIVSLLEHVQLNPIVLPVVREIQPFELLEPVDDLAKQFSDVMAVSIMAILLQRLLLVVSEAWAFKVILPFGCAVLVISACFYRYPEFRRRLAGVGRGAVVLAVFARLVVPVAAWIGDDLTVRGAVRRETGKE